MRTVVSDGAAEDLIRSFVQMGCAELHQKTLVEKYNAQLENGLIDVEDSEAVRKQIEKINDASDELDALAECRRGLMLCLLNMYDGDKDYWCLVKHIGNAMYCAFEAYQATGNADIYEEYLSTNRRFIHAMTHFLGVEITDCAACFADALKAGRDKDEQATGNKGTV